MLYSSRLMSHCKVWSFCVIKNSMELLKRKDGSVSKRGLWDNIRDAKGSGKKPTKAMLAEAKKIKAKKK